MRFVMIEPKHRRIFDTQASVQLSEMEISRLLRCDFAERVELSDDMDLWVPSDPKPRSFRLFSDGPEYFGSGLLCGRTRLDDCKSLPRFYNFEMVEGWFTFPRQGAGSPLPRRQIIQRPTEFPLPALLKSYHGNAAFAARASSVVGPIAAGINGSLPSRTTLCACIV